MSKNIGAKIRNARLNLSQKLGYTMSQREFGALCGWGNAQSRCSNYETGRREPSLEDLLKIIAVSGASPTDFFEDDELEGINMSHVEQAFTKYQEESAIPKTLTKTLHYPEIENSITPVLLDRCPSRSKEIPESIALFSADRDTDIANKRDTLWVDASQKKITKRGVWMLLIGSEAVHTKCIVKPDGTVESEDFGILSEDTNVLGKCVLHTRAI